MAQPKYLSLKGEVFSRIRGSNGVYEPFFNIESGQLTMSRETSELTSNGNTSGTLASDEISRSMAFNLTVNSLHKENMQKSLYANSREVGAAEDVAYTLPAGPAGSLADLGRSNITEATFGTLVEGVDYSLSAKNGTIEYLKPIVETPGTFSHDKFTELGVFSAEDLELELLYISKRSSHTYQFYRAKFNPAQALDLVSSGSNYATLPLSGTMLVDPTAPVDGNLGQYGRLRTID